MPFLGPFLTILGGLFLGEFGAYLAQKPIFGGVKSRKSLDTIPNNEKNQEKKGTVIACQNPKIVKIDDFLSNFSLFFSQKNVKNHHFFLNFSKKID